MEIKHWLQLFMECVLLLPVSLILTITTASSIAIFEKLKVLKRQPLQFHLSYQRRKVKMKDWWQSSFLRSFCKLLGERGIFFFAYSGEQILTVSSGQDLPVASKELRLCEKQKGWSPSLLQSIPPAPVFCFNCELCLKIIIWRVGSKPFGL